MIKILNKNRPGLPDYSGPTKGFFSLRYIIEYTPDVMRRVEYVKENKPAKEAVIRLANMLYLNPVLCPAVITFSTLCDDYNTKILAMCADCKSKRKDNLYSSDFTAKLNALNADFATNYDALSADVITYVKKVIPDCAWIGKEMLF